MRSTVILFCFAIALHAAVPEIESMQPRAVQRGKSATVYIRGQALVRGAQVETTAPASFGHLTVTRDPLAEHAPAKPDTLLPFLVTVPPTAAPGVYPIRLKTRGGISNVALFIISDSTEAEEAEVREPEKVNHTPETAQKLVAGTIVNGTLTNADIDLYQFYAVAGQKMVFEIEARRIGSAIDPAVEILDAAGRVVAKNNDAPGLDLDSRIELAFPRTGRYYLRVHDSSYSEQTENFYRLRTGRYPFADAIFPLGWKRGEAVNVELAGGNLPKPVTVTPATGVEGVSIPVGLPDQGTIPFRFVLSDSAEAIEPADLREGVIINGRLSKPGESDQYKMVVEPGQPWVFSLTAASLGTSLLDGVLVIRDESGKILARQDDGDGPDPILPLTVPENVRSLSVSVEDLLGRGGLNYAYRLQARSHGPDFLVELLTPFVNVPAGGTAQVACLIRRQGYDGEIRLSIPGLPEGFHVSGGHVPNEAAQQSFNDNNATRRLARSVLTITADADVQPAHTNLTVVAETPGGMRRQARGPGLIVPVRGDRRKPVAFFDLGMTLPFSTAEPLPVTLDIPAPLVRISQGFEYQIDYAVKARDGARVMGKVNSQVAGAVGNLRILKGAPAKNPNAGSFLLNTNFETPATVFDMVFTVDAEVGGKTQTITSPALEVEVVRGYAVNLPHEIRLHLGTGIRLPGSLFREITFEGGPVRIKAEDLPDGVVCKDVEVPAGTTAFLLECDAAASAKPGTHTIRITSVAPETGRKAKSDYRIPDRETKLIIGEPPQ